MEGLREAMEEQKRAVLLISYLYKATEFPRVRTEKEDS